MAKTDSEVIEELKKRNEELEKKFGKFQSAFTETASNFNMSFNGFKNYTASILPGIESINEAMKSTIANMNPKDAMGFLDIEATEIQNAFGVSKQRVGEFKQSIADLAVSYVWPITRRCCKNNYTIRRCVRYYWCRRSRSVKRNRSCFTSYRFRISRISKKF